MVLIVLNYGDGSVNIIKNIPNDILDMDTFVYDTLDYKESEIAWILVEDDFLVERFTYNPNTCEKLYDNENFIK